MSLIAPAAEAWLRTYARWALSERGGYRLVRWVRRCRPRSHWNDIFRTPQGLAMQLDLGVYPDCTMAFGLYELATARMIRRLLGPGDHFVDAGANIGYFTLLAARRVGPTGRVDAFEPQPENRARLMSNLHRNDLAQRVQVHPSALTDAAGQATIFIYTQYDEEHNHGCCSLYARPDDPQTIGLETPTVRLDEALGGRIPTLIKMDVEGAEAAAVAGMQRILTAAKPPVLIGEYNPTQVQGAGVAAHEWVMRAVRMQPRYRLYVIAARPRRIDPTPRCLGQLRQGNLMLRV